MAAEIKVGDVVRLKSGGHNMTVQAIDGSTVTVIWFDPITNTIQSKGNVVIDAFFKIS
jgi:uncharacterized protein YodC (DUF2158 family)